MLGSTLPIPFILQIPMCFQGNKLVISEILSTIFFVSRIATFLQTTSGVRLIYIFFFAVIFELWARAREVEATGTDYCYDSAKKYAFGLIMRKENNRAPRAANEHVRNAEHIQCTKSFSAKQQPI